MAYAVSSVHCLPTTTFDMASMKVLSSTCFFLLRSSQAFQKPAFSSHLFSSTSLNMSKPFAVIVEAEIQPERMDEFLKMIENNAVNSRKEPGCLRFGKWFFG